MIGAIAQSRREEPQHHEPEINQVQVAFNKQGSEMS
jgi:hypothetical protein